MATRLMQRCGMWMAVVSSLLLLSSSAMAHDPWVMWCVRYCTDFSGDPPVMVPQPIRGTYVGDAFCATVIYTDLDYWISGDGPCNTDPDDPPVCNDPAVSLYDWPRCQYLTTERKKADGTWETVAEYCCTADVSCGNTCGDFWPIEEPFPIGFSLVDQIGGPVVTPGTYKFTLETEDCCYWTSTCYDSMLDGGRATTTIEFNVRCPSFNIDLDVDNDCSCGPTQARVFPTTYTSDSDCDGVPEEHTLSACWSIEGDSQVATIDENGLITPGELAGWVKVLATMVVDGQGTGCVSERELWVGGDCGCSGGDCGTLGSGNVQTRSVEMHFQMGKGGEGKTAGQLWVVEAEPTPELYTPASLHYSHSSNPDVEILRDENGIRQVLAPDGLADVVYAPPGTGYQIQFYLSDFVSAKDPYGFYTHSGDPFITWEISDPGISGDFQLAVKKWNGATQVAAYRYHHDTTGGDPMWILTTYKVVDNTEVLVKTESRYTTAADGVRHHEVVDPVLGLVYHEDQTRETWEGGSVVVNTIVDPAGAALTTHREYYRDENQHPTQVKSVTYPDGSWVYYEYNATFGRKTLEVHPWLDLEMPGTPTASTGRAIVYEYEPVDGLDELSGFSAGSVNDTRPRTVTEKIQGVTVAKAYYVYGYDVVGNERQYWQIEERCTSPAASYGDPTNARTVTTFILGDRNRIASIAYPDGRLDTYSHEVGTYTPGANHTPGTFEPGEGSDRRTAIVHGTNASPGGITDKTTGEATIEDYLGRTLLEETWVCPFDFIHGTGRRIAWTVYEPDELGRTEAQYRSDGTLVETDYEDCCRKWTVTDESGLQTTYGRDVQGRMDYTIKRGVPGYGTYPAHGAILTDYACDAAGQLRETMVVPCDEDGVPIPGSPSLITRQEYDVAGRLTRELDVNTGLETNYDYQAATGGGRLVIAERLGQDEQGQPVQEITEYFRDGKIEKVTGTAVVARAYAYDTDASHPGWQTTIEYTGPGTTRWVKTCTDMLGRRVQEQRPDASGGASHPTQTWVYDNNASGYGVCGRLEKIVQSGLAETLYEYDPDMPWEVIRTGLDVDSSTGLVLASNDRASETLSYYAQDQGEVWWQTSVQKVFALNASGQPVLKQVSEVSRQLTGLPAGTIACTVSKDVHNNETVSTTTLDRTNGIVTQTTNVPDSAENAVTVTRHGLLQETTSTTGINTRFGYDALARQTTSIDPRTGTTTTTYDPDTGQITQVEDTEQRTTSYAYFEYDETPTPHYPGGLKSVTNAERKVIYYDYNAHGQVTKTWGHVPQPTWVEYDVFGQRKKLHTYQTEGTGPGYWSGSTWPDAGNGDVTEWTYDEESGLLEAKIYADSSAVTYTYTPDGKLETRTWARMIGNDHPITTYVYDEDTSDLIGVEYRIGENADPDTPDVTYTRDRRGRIATVTDVLGERTMNYNDALQLESEVIPGIIGRTITHNYAESEPLLGRPTGLTVGTEYTTTWHYDDYGRLNRVQGPGLPAYGAVYTFTVDGQSQPISDLIAKIEFRPTDSTLVADSQRTYEAHRDLPITVLNATMSDYTTTVRSQYDYAYDALGRRDYAANSGSAFTTFSQVAFSDYAYNHRNELVSSERRQGTPANPGNLVPGQDFGYRYDPIGNREGAWVDDEQSQTTYTRNELNQYVSTSQPAEDFEYDYDVVGEKDGNLTQDGTFDYDYDGENRLIAVTPRAPVLNSVKLEYHYDYLGRRVQKIGKAWTGTDWSAQPTLDRRFVYDGWNLIMDVDGLPVGSARVHRYFTWGMDLSGQNGSASVSGLHGAGGIGGLLAVKDKTTPGFGGGGGLGGSMLAVLDTEGNLSQLSLQDVVLQAGDGEGGAGGEGGVGVSPATLLFADESGNTGEVSLADASAPSLGASLAYTDAEGEQALLDLADVQEVDGSEYLVFTDDSGNVGVSLLTGSVPPQEIGVKNYLYLYDANGNVGQLIDWVSTARSIVAHYEYDPYGNQLVAAGPYAASNPFRFSTKYWDAESEKYYYGYRYYDPRLGRWVNRDPIEERGGLNLYGAVRNAPVLYIDEIGLDTCDPWKETGWISPWVKKPIRMRRPYRANGEDLISNVDVDFEILVGTEIKIILIGPGEAGKAPDPVLGKGDDAEITIPWKRIWIVPQPQDILRGPKEKEDSAVDLTGRLCKRWVQCVRECERKCIRCPKFNPNDTGEGFYAMEEYFQKKYIGGNKYEIFGTLEVNSVSPFYTCKPLPLGTVIRIQQGAGYKLVSNPDKPICGESDVAKCEALNK